MSFANLSPLMVAAGLAGLAALLYAMQRLRIRYREIEVVTTLFWREALHEAPARVFRQRFRHWPAYLLILAICSLIWIAIAEPNLNVGSGDDNYVLLLDGSAGMARTTNAGETRFDQAVASLKGDLAGLPTDSRRVLMVGATVRNLLAPGEHSLLFDQRLESLAPEVAPSGMEQQLRHLARFAGTDETTVLIYGDAPISAKVLDGLPPSMIVQRATDIDIDPGNAGITALGVGEPSSGRWSEVDVFLKIEHDDDRVAAMGDFTINVDSVPLDGATVEVGSEDGSFIVRGVPATGGLLAVILNEDDQLGLDNEARLRLPDRTRMRVLLSPSLSPALGIALASDLAVELVEDGADIAADIVVRRRGETLGVGLPALEFVPMADQQAAFLLSYAGDWDDRLELASAVESLGLNQIDAMGLAETSGQAIEVAIEPGTTSTFSVWEELLGPEYNFVQSRSFPLFVARSLRWLADTRAWYPYAAAGEPLRTEVDGRAHEFVDKNGEVLETLGTPFVPGKAGPLPDASGDDAIYVSLLDPATTMADKAISDDSRATEIASAGLVDGIRAQDLMTWLLVLALLLLSAEWYFYQKGRMP